MTEEYMYDEFIPDEFIPDELVPDEFVPDEFVPRKKVESVESKIQSINAQIQQMMNMIAENERLIAEDDDVEGRTFLNNHLAVEIANCQAEIDMLNNLPSREEAVELQNALEEAYILLYGGND